MKDSELDDLEDRLKEKTSQLAEAEEKLEEAQRFVVR